MRKIKIFQEFKILDLTKKVNSWVSENTTILDTTIHQTKMGEVYTLVVTYEKNYKV